jgi:cellulose synthase (UDP-forming)
MDFKDVKAEKIRRLIAIFALIVTVFYLYWRVTETLNPEARLFSWALWSAELFSAVSTFLFYFAVWRPLTRKSPEPLLNRTVDVFIPTKDESVSVLRKSLLACNDMKYPHRTVLLDDGDRPEVKALCDELNIDYLARPSHEGAKAGNLNYALEHSTAEFIAVFDADHAPLPHFIDRLIGYFRDDKVAFVQAPQEFYNIDSFQHRVDHKKKYIWGEQYLFFSLIQPGRDRWGAAYFVGSCALLRRKALDDVGGFATGSITEDMLTSIKIHGKGWKSAYHNENLAYGIAAETLLPFHIQRYRWGIGGWQVFFKANPLFVRGLSLSQRLCYLAGMIYPIEGFQKLIFYATPPIALFTGVLPMRALDINYILHFVPYYVITLFAFNEMGRGYGGNLLLEQFSMGKYATYIRSLGAFFLRGGRSKFRVTPKGRAGAHSHLLIIPQAAVLVVSIIAITWALYELLLGSRHDDFVVAVNCLWALYNSGLGLAIIRYDYKKLVQRRKDYRVRDSLPVIYHLARRKTETGHLAVADNLTKDGLSLLAIGRIPLSEHLDLKIILPRHNLVASAKVVQGKTTKAKGHIISKVGVKFEEVSIDHQDWLSRYIQESSVSKFMNEYSTRYKTYLERHFTEQKRQLKRAYRALAYLPVVVHAEDGDASHAVIKNMSSSGLLLTVRDDILQGEHITVETVIGDEVIAMKGIVVRRVSHDAEEFTEYFLGVKLDESSIENAGRILEIADRVAKLLYP